MKDKRFLFASFFSVFVSVLSFPADIGNEITVNPAEPVVRSGTVDAPALTLDTAYASLLKHTIADPLPALEIIYKEEKNPRKAINELKKYLPDLATDEDKARVHEYIAVLEALMGDLSGSLADYEGAASLASGTGRGVLLLESARLASEIGEYDEAVRKIDELTGLVEPGNLPIYTLGLKALILSKKGDCKGALSCIESMERSDPSETGPGILYLRYTVFTGCGRHEESEKVFFQLKEKYPSSPEYAWIMEAAGLDPGMRVRGYPTPEWIFSSDVKEIPGNEEPAVQRTEDLQPETNVVENRSAVQAGSFRMKENADYLAKELGNKGFTARTMEKKSDGDLLFTVLVVPDKKSESLSRLLARLHESGFEGFIVSMEAFR